MTNSGVVSRIGRWLDRHFPAKMSVEEVEARFTVMLNSLNDLQTRLVDDEKIFNLSSDRVSSIEGSVSGIKTDHLSLEAIVKNLESDLSKVKTIVNAARIGLGQPSAQEVWKR